MEMAYQVSLKYLLLLMIPVSIGTLFYRHQVINVLYGGEYAATSSALSILIWATTFMMLNMTITTFLISIYQQKIFTLMAFCLMVANLTFNFLLIPPFSFVGAAIATVLTEGLFTVLGVFYLARFHDLLPSFSLLRLIPVNLVFILFLVFFSKYSVFVIVPVSIPIYLALLTIFGGVGRFEVDLVKKVFARA
jgi:O-antigen/teichoic acid export membrane protein